MGPFDRSPFDPPDGSDGNGMAPPNPLGGSPPPGVAPPEGMSSPNPQGGSPPTGTPPPNFPDASPPPDSWPPDTPPASAMPPSAGPIHSVPSNGNGMSPSMPEDAPDVPNGMSPSMPEDVPDVPNGMSSDELTQPNLPSLSMADLLELMPSVDELTLPTVDEIEWAVPSYSVADAAEDRYALETRAESLNVLAYGDAVRRGETDFLRTGNGENFTDGVAGEETVEVDGLLLERIGRGSRLVAQESETTVHGRMSVSAVGWKSTSLSGEDSIMLGGALTDTWTGGLLITSAMSDDLAIGVGTRLTAPVDMWLNQLTGMEERPGTAAADGIMVDLAGTLFEREYGMGTHESAMAVFSGAVHQTQRQGFWPMMRVAVGVRNLLPGAGTPASEAAPPSPPPAGAGGAEGALVATNLAGGAAGSVRSGDALPDAIRGVEAAEDLQEISNLRHADNTAVQLDELTTAARNVEVEMPNGMGAAELPDATPPPDIASIDDLQAQHVDDGLGAWQSPMSADQLRDAALRPGVDAQDALRRLDELIADRLTRIGAATPEQIDQLNTMMAGKLSEITGAGDEVYRAEDLVGYADKGGSSFIGRRRGEAVAVPWPRTPLVGDEAARQTQLYAELDALATVKRALEDSQDPAKALADALAELEALHGVPTPDSSAYLQWQALTDAQVYLKGLSDVGAKAEMTTDLDFYMLVRSELVAGRDPRVAVQAAVDGLDEGSDTRRYAQNLLDSLDRGGFAFGGQVPEALDASALRDQWSELASQLDAAARQLDDGTEEGYERARALRDVSGELSLARMNMSSGYDPRDSLGAMARRLEGRTFLDGADGAGEASILRTAIAEYAGLLDEFTAGTTAVSGLDEGISPTAVGGVGRLAGDAPIDPSPPYPGLPDDFGADLRLTIDPPAYSEAFPPAMPDEVRLLLDTQPEQLAGGAEEGASLGARLELNVATESTVAPIQPQMDEFGPRWARVEDGNAAATGSFERAIVVDNGRMPIPDNYEVVRMPEDTEVRTVAASTDTEAVVRSMAARAAPEGADWRQTFEALNDDYMNYRRESTWRVMAEYENAVEVLRDDLRRAITDFGGDADQFTAQTPVTQLYDALDEIMDNAEMAEDAHRMQVFIDGFEAKTYDVYADLAQRSDEFEGIRSGATFPLDRHIDQDKMTEFLEQRFTDAMANADPTNQASRDEVAFYQQAHLAAKEGRNPLVDLGDQISYLGGKFDPNVPIEDLPEDLQTTARQAQNFQLHQQELIDLLSDPAFHKSAAVMGDDTYARVNFLRAELGNPPPTGVGDVQTRIFDSEVAQLGGGTETVSGNYVGNQQAINEHVGGNDFARVPEAMPEGVEPPPVQAVEEVPQGPRGVLSNADAGGGPVGLSRSRIVNRGPDGQNVPDEIMELWAQRMLGESNDAARGNQGGFGNYMDQMAELRTPAQRMEDRVSRNPYAAARVEAANQMWDAQRGRDVRPPAEWERLPDTNGMRSWDSNGWRLPPADRARVRKSVRFGGADVLMVPFDAEDVRKARTQFGDLDEGNATLSWWTGSGINRPTEALDADEAVRHVPAPRLATDRPSYPSSWRASRQPGFGRLADAPGAFPVNAREQMVTDLMQGKRLDSSHIDLLQGTLNDAVRADRVQHREWLKMNGLIRSLRGGVVLGDTRSFTRAFDSKTLATMLNMLDSAAAVL